VQGNFNTCYGIGLNHTRAAPPSKGNARTLASSRRTLALRRIWRGREAGTGASPHTSSHTLVSIRLNGGCGATSVANMGKRKASGAGGAGKVGTAMATAAAAAKLGSPDDVDEMRVPAHRPPPRDEQRAAWDSLVARLRAHGGLIDDGVGISWEDGGGGGDGGRGWVATKPIATGATLLRVPSTCMVTARAALQSAVGRRVCAAVTADAAAVADPPRLPLADLALAAFIAVDSRDPASLHAPYHALLAAEVGTDG